ncbi:hypothetical protein VTI28DRAFT_8840 [Corynascus sepedonium]
MLSVVADIYSPLDNDHDEIRLLTITNLPIPSELVHCCIEKVSLQNLRDEYAAYLGSSSAIGKSQRTKVLRWSVRHGVQECSDTAKRCVPPEAACRFSWGDFAALSYVWGSPRDRRNILLNGEVTSVTRNLESALRELAQQGDFSRGYYKLWVDALCINQGDADEQASQINKMREIYHGSWAVIAWLGEGNEDSDLAFDLLSQFSTMTPKQQGELANQLPKSLDPRWTKAFYGLNELMKGPYWLRLWIVQEVVLGGTAAVLCCGSNRIEWTTFCEGLDVLFRRDMYIVKDKLLRVEVARRRSRRDPVWHTLSLHLVHKDLWTLSRHDDSKAKRSLGFRRLLDIACSSVCRDKRDKVFSLLGMIEPEIAEALVHDYSTKTSQLFEAVTRLFITHFNSLEPLREGNPWGKTGTPSWAADWTWDGRFRYSRVESPVWGAWQNKDVLEPQPEYIFRAAGNLSPQYSFLGDGVLESKGFVIDSIAGLGARANGYFGWHKRSIRQAQGWKSTYGGRAETATAIAQTLMLGHASSGQPAEDRHSAAMLHLPSTFDHAGPQFARRGWRWLSSQDGYYFRWEFWRSANDTLELGDLLLQAYFDNDIPPDADEADYDDVYGAFDRSCKEWRLMLTEKGYIGWAPDNMYGTGQNQTRVGDMICIIPGCSVPLVVRPLRDKWQIIGEAYVQGIMNAITTRKDHESPHQANTVTKYEEGIMMSTNDGNQGASTMMPANDNTTGEHSQEAGAIARIL